MADVFVTYHFDDEQPENVELIQRVAYHLRKQRGLDAYCYAGPKKYALWREEVGEHVAQCEGLVLFVGRAVGTVQSQEALAFLERYGNNIDGRVAVVRLPDACELPRDLFQYIRPSFSVEPRMGRDDVPWIEEQSVRCAGFVVNELRALDLVWTPPDGLPVGYPFSYEKDIIEEFVRGKGRIRDHGLIQDGCPLRWPSVDLIGSRDTSYHNPIPEDVVGRYRPDEDGVLVDARTRYHNRAEGPEGRCLTQYGLVFPEAGPRANLYHPDDNFLRVGILVSGGIAPGINAVVSGIVERHQLYRDESRRSGRPYQLEMRGFRDGLAGLAHGTYVQLHRTQTRDLLRDSANRGGTFLGTSRFDELLETQPPDKRAAALRGIVTMLANSTTDILYIIGGDGSMRAAHSIQVTARRMYDAKEIERPISVVAIPKTIHNDVLWVWQSFGFLSAVEKAKQLVRHLHTEAQSNPRLCVVQLLGCDSGFVVSHTALASGVCDAVLIPEATFRVGELSKWIRTVLADRFVQGEDGRSPFGLVLLAEAAIPRDIGDYLHDPDVGLAEGERLAVQEFIDNGWRACGETLDELRSAGLKVVSRVLERDIRRQRGGRGYWKGFRVFTNEPRHLIRAVDPSVQDVIFAQRLGALAVDNAMAGYHDFMISQWLTEFVLVPLELVTMGRKRVPQHGVFWKSVLANTGQPPDLDPGEEPEKG